MALEGNNIMSRDIQPTRRKFLQATARITATAAGLGTFPLLAPHFASAAPTTPNTSHRISYYRKGEIYVNEPGKSEGTPITTGHMDFKPSWSKTDDMLVCFRRTKDDPVTANWKSAIFIVHVDGSGFHLLSDGTRTDFNPTWTRDGLNTPVWNRKNDEKGGYCIMQSKVGGKPGEEIALTDPGFHNWAHSCLTDGRILVNAAHPTMGWGVYLLTRRGKMPNRNMNAWSGNSARRAKCTGPAFRRARSGSASSSCVGTNSRSPGTRCTSRISIGNLARSQTSSRSPIRKVSPSGMHTHAGLKVSRRVVYHSSETGKNQLYVYRLEDGSTRRVSTDPNADYRYPHGEAGAC